MLLEEFKRCINSVATCFLDERKIETLENAVCFIDDLTLTYKVLLTRQS